MKKFRNLALACSLSPSERQKKKKKKNATTTTMFLLAALLCAAASVHVSVEMFPYFLFVLVDFVCDSVVLLITSKKKKKNDFFSFFFFFFLFSLVIGKHGDLVAMR
jgi:cytochrome bd-type quinol oxidase subunit 2